MIDCFTFYKDLDMLEIRLNSLAPYVRQFVLCESPIRFDRKPKPLYYELNKDRFKDFNITHLVCDGKHWEGLDADPNELFYMLHCQRQYLIEGVKEEDPDMLIMISDTDEIPNLMEYDGVSEGVFKQKVYCFYCNVYTGKDRWNGPMVFKKKNITKSIRWLTKKRNQLPIAMENGGWHFTSTGTTEDYLDKMAVSGHCWMDHPDIYKEQALKNRNNLIDQYHKVWQGRNRPRRFSVEMPSGPKWLLENKYKYPHLWYSHD